jgi:hypothetical protein
MPSAFRVLADRRAPDTVPEIAQRALDPAVAPVRVVGRHADDERLDPAHDAAAAHTWLGVRPLGRDQSSVPAHDRVRRDDRGHALEQAAPQDLASRLQAAALVIAQAQPSVAELLLEHAVLLDQVLDRALVLAEGPSGQGEELDPERVDVG